MADKPLTYRQAKAMWRLGGSRRAAEVIAILFGPKAAKP